jgi:hypothetical protein
MSARIEPSSKQAPPQVTADPPAPDDTTLTWEGFKEIAERMWGTLDSKRFQDRMHILSTQFQLKLNRVRVAPSAVHGQGVFAARDLAAGELLTFYPGHVVEYTPKEDRHVDGHWGQVMCSNTFRAVYGDKKEDVENKMNNEFSFMINRKFTIIGCAELPMEPAYLGHIINDAAQPTSARNAHGVYLAASKAKANARFEVVHDAHVAAVAHSDIKAGDEIFVTYGMGYWQGHFAQHSPEGKDVALP